MERLRLIKDIPKLIKNGKFPTPSLTPYSFLFWNLLGLNVFSINSSWTQ